MMIFKQEAPFFPFYTGYVNYVACPDYEYSYMVYFLTKPSDNKIWNCALFILKNYIFKHSVCHMGALSKYLLNESMMTENKPSLSTL